MNNRKCGIITGLSGLLLLVGILLLSVLMNRSRAHSARTVTLFETGKLRVATEKSRVGFALGEKTALGFNYEIVKAFAHSMDLELEISLVNNMDSAITGLHQNKYDLVACNIPNTSEMQKKVNLSVPLLNSRQMLIQRTGNDSVAPDTLVTDHRMLHNQKIYIAGGSPFRFRLENLSGEIADTIHITEVESATTEKLVKAVSEGKIKYTICDELQARKLSAQYSNIDFSVPVGFNQHFCWAVDKKSLRLLHEINEFLNDFLQSDDYWNIYRKYY